MKLNLTIKKYINKASIIIKLVYILFSLFLIARLYEYFSLKPLYSSINLTPYFRGIFYDFITAIVIGFTFAIFIIPLSQKWQKRAVIPLSVFVGIIGFITFSLSQYFLTTLVALDHTILAYSTKDLFYIALASVVFTPILIVKIVLSVLLPSVIAFFWLSKPSFSRSTTIILIVFLLIGTIFFKEISHKIRPGFEYSQSVNKVGYFVVKIVAKLKGESEKTLSDVFESVEEFQKNRPNAKYLNLFYPFIREDQEKDVLGEYFEFDEEKPNIVIIIIESLSQNISGKNPKYLSFTPFLDSLAEHSLHWTSFLSTSERTFNILPSVLASLPYGEKGFMSLLEKQETYPSFQSLPKILAENGYWNNFFYGGWSGFDYMEPFLLHNANNFILNEDKYPAKYDKIQSTEDGFTWGYPDKALYSRSFEILDSLPHNPRLDVYMTLSTHSPFFPPNAEYYRKKMVAMLAKSRFTEGDKNIFLSQDMKFPSVLYADDCLRYFFAEYGKRKDFKNTIFVILGDHFMSITDYTPLEKYHVPLVIYSPMLKKADVFPAVSSTADITPTILALLKDNFQLKTPKNAHWLGRVVDTSKTFQSKNYIPLMLLNRDIDEFLYNEYFLSEGNLYRIDEKLQLYPIDDKKKTEKIKKELEYFKILNKYVCEKNTIYFE